MYGFRTQGRHSATPINLHICYVASAYICIRQTSQGQLFAVDAAFNVVHLVCHLDLKTVTVVEVACDCEATASQLHSSAVVHHFIHGLQIQVTVQQGVSTHRLPLGQVPLSQLIPGPDLHTESIICKQALCTYVALDG